MLILLKEDDLNNERLSWLCIEPALIQSRAKAPAEKAAIYNELREGQKALYMFYAFHNHVNSISEMYWYASYFISDLKAWPLMRKSVQFFQDDVLLKIYDDTHTALEAELLGTDDRWRNASPSDLEGNEKLFENVRTLYEKYEEAAAAAIRNMNSYIKKHPDEFYELVN